MSITYEEALATLNSMFTEPWNVDHLDTVLRHFKGHMEDTVEAILTHGESDPDALIARLKSGGGNTSSGANQILMDEEIARQIAAEDKKGKNGSVVPIRSSAFTGGGFPGTATMGRTTAGTKSKPAAPSLPSLKNKNKRGTPADLPPDFLRIPGIKYEDLDADEALARMLQDDLFTEEIANNPEFAHLARGRIPSQASRYGGPNRASAASLPQNNQGPNIMDKIAQLGDEAKKRLTELSAQWSNKTNQNSQVSERRGLLDGGDSEEVDFLGQNEYEMKPIQNKDNTETAPGLLNFANMGGRKKSD